MKGIMVGVVVGVVLSIASVSHAVPPAYEGQFGNPEEPALRVVKWPWLGVRKLVMHTHDGLKSGIECHPPAAVCQGARGATHGTCILIDHTGRGMIYSQLPPKGPLHPGGSYEQQAQAYIDEVVWAREQGDHPTVHNGDASAEPAIAVDEHGNPYLPLQVRERAVFKAQRHYVPQRTAQRDRKMNRRENLLLLAR